MRELVMRNSFWGMRFVSLILIGLTAGCGDSGSTDDTLTLSNFGSDPAVPNSGVIPLTAADVTTIIRRAAAALDDRFLHIAVVDRRGFPLGVYSSRADGVLRDQDNLALSLARTTGFFANSQAPLSSRTVQFLSTFHFPPTFAGPFIPSLCPESGGVVGAADCRTTVLAPSQTTTGIAGTPRGPLWQIESTNRGALVAALDPGIAVSFGPAPADRPFPFFTPTSPTFDDGATGTVNEETFYNPGQEFPRSLNLDGTGPSAGIVRLPGAIPLYKANGSGIPRMVGGIGCFIRSDDPTEDPDILAAEYAALTGATGSGAVGDENFAFQGIPFEGAIFLAGILLPYVKQTTLPAGRTAGDIATVPLPPPQLPGGGLPFVAGSVGVTPWLLSPRDGAVAPFSSDPNPDGPNGNTYLVGPKDGSETDRVGLTRDEVIQIVTQCVNTADGNRAAVRLPVGVTAKIIITITDTRGVILAHYRMEDTLCDAVDVVPAKARTPTYWSLPPEDPRSGTVLEADFPAELAIAGTGIAFSTTGVSFVGQPFYPPGIDAEPPGPLFNLAEANQLPQNVNRQGSALPEAAVSKEITAANFPPVGGFPEPLVLFGGFGNQNGLIWFPGGVPLYKNGVVVGGLGVSGDGVENNDFIAAGGAVGFEPPDGLRNDNFKFDDIVLPYLKFPENPGPGG